MKVAVLAAVVLAGMAGSTCATAQAFPDVPGDEPMIVAHRAGTGDFPENTLLAINQAVSAGVDGMWLTVQISSDGVPVLYRPADLATLTEGTGPVNTKTAQQLQQLNAGWNFTAPGGDGYPYRQQPTPIPTLEQAIAATPPDVVLFLDLKQTPARPLVSAVAQIVRDSGAAQRSIVYSTNADITSAAALQPDLQVAESRDSTRQRLLNLALNHRCDPPHEPGRWAGFEMHRDVTVTEEFTLGTGTSQLEATLWDPAAVECFKAVPGMRVMGFAVNTADDYRLARKIGLDAVLVDSPRAAEQWRSE